MFIFITFLSVYAVLSIFGIFTLYYRRFRTDSVSNVLKQVTLHDFSPSEKLNALAHLATIQEHESPWYERSLSTVGVIAFFSMTIASGVQLIKTTVESVKSDQLQQEIAAMNRERSVIEGFLGRVSRAVAAQYTETGRLDSAGKEILEHRLKELRLKEIVNHDELVETFTLALLLRDYETAKGALDRNIKLLDDTRPSDVISLAEYEVLEGAPNTANEYLRKIEPALSTLPSAWQVRVIVLDTVINGNDDIHAKRLASLLGIDTEQASRRLSADVARFRVNSPLKTQ